MDRLLSGNKPLLPGIRFHPTDEELFMYYLKRKVMGKSLLPQMIAEVDVYKFAVWDLPEKSYLKTRDLNWYFFCPRGKKYANGERTNRATEYGYWKSTGNDRTVEYNHRPVGKIKTLIFHHGKPPNGDRTDWVMHEYRLEDKVLADMGVPQDAYVICKIYQKSGLGPKNGENYEAPFIEEEWESDYDDDSLERELELALHPSMVAGSLDTRSHPANSWAPQLLAPIETEEDELDMLLAQFTEVGNNEAREDDELDRTLARFTEDDIAVNEDNETTADDAYICLEDLEADGSYFPPRVDLNWVDLNWSQIFLDDDDCYLELNDLKD